MAGLSYAVSALAVPVAWEQGWTEPVRPAPVAAGVATIGHTAPGEYWELVVTARATFTADATLGTRSPRLEYVDPGGNVLYAVQISSGIAPSGTVTANLAVLGEYAPVASGVSSMAWPSILMQSGYTIRFAADGVGVADAWSGCVFTVQRFPTDITRGTE